MIFGLDYLGGANYDDLIVREHPEGWAAGFILNTNKPYWKKTNAWPVIEKLVATKRCPAPKVHAVWDDEHKYNPKIHDIIIFKELDRANKLKIKFPNFDIQFSPICEHNIKGSQLKKLAERIEAKAKDLTLVNSVFNGDFIFRSGWRNEIHGNKNKPHKGKYQYSTDGDNCVDIDITSLKEKHIGAEILFFWHPAFNGKLKADDKTPRDKRKAWPTSDLIDSIIALHREREVNNNLSKNFTLKSHADRHSTPPEPRAYKPVYIIPHKVKQLELVADNGQVVAVSGKPEPFVDGRWRYYFNQYGYQIANKARRIQGKAAVHIKVGDKFMGMVDPSFRAGSFR